jgi:hypothetical protein
MNFETLIEKVKNIPYGRNANRYDFSLVLSENKGTCSSKHAFLKDFADNNGIENVKLFIGIFKMNEANTPKLGNLLSNNNIEYIPEAHCYLKINQVPVDVTTVDSFYDKIKQDIIEEIEISPNQVSDFKVEYHKAFLKKWINETNQNNTFEEIWKIREKCILKLSE